MKSARSQSFSRLCSVCRSVGPSVTFVFFVVFRSHPVPTRAPSAMSLRGSVYDYTALFKRVQYVFSLNIIDMEQHEPGPNPFFFCSFFFVANLGFQLHLVETKGKSRFWFVAAPQPIAFCTEATRCGDNGKRKMRSMHRAQILIIT